MMFSMRTTLTLDDDIARQLRALAYAQGTSFKQVVNATLRAGLARGDGAPSPPYRLRPASMGTPAAGVDLRKALQLADALEDAEIERELERGK